MDAQPQQESLLEQLDRMQDEVLQGLDDLDERVLGLIKQCTAANERQLTLSTPPDHAEAA